MLKVLLISPPVYVLPPKGYSGLEYLLWHLANGLNRRGFKVSVVAPDGSRLDDGVELIPSGLREPEEEMWKRYRDRLEEFQVIIDATWERWSIISSSQRFEQLPIINWFHTSPSIYSTPPPVRYPMLVGLSKSHAAEMEQHWCVPARFIYNGVDTGFYRSTGEPRGDRFLALGRYTPEKGFLNMAILAKRLRIGLDIYGDTEIIASQEYASRVMEEADGFFVRCHPGVSREATVRLYSRAKGLLHLHTWNEPFSLVVVEAMSCGLPPIASRRGGPSETIRDGVTGFLVDSEEDVRRLIERRAIDELDPEAMRRHVEERFSMERFIDRWEELIRRVHAGLRW